MSRSDRTIVAALSEQGGSALKQIQYNEEGNAVKVILAGLRSSQLPSQLWQLADLQELVLIGNQLSSLPAEIGYLTHLRILNLRDNRLATLPVVCQEVCKISVPGCLVSEAGILSLWNRKLRMTA